MGVHHAARIQLSAKDIAPQCASVGRLPKSPVAPLREHGESPNMRALVALARRVWQATGSAGACFCPMRGYSTYDASNARVLPTVWAPMAQGHTYGLIIPTLSSNDSPKLPWLRLHLAKRHTICQWRG